MKTKHSLQAQKKSVVTLKAVADYVGLTAGTVSVVLNNSKSASSIPEHTRSRILEAARKLNYRPNFVARSLRVKRTFTIGVITAEFGDAYGGEVLGGIEIYLRAHNYFLLAVAHRHDIRLQHDYADLLTSRGVEGLITIDTSVDVPPLVPTVAVAGHQRVENVTNIVLDHRVAARLALKHLKDLGHKRIAFLRGQQQSSDSSSRWEALREAASELEISILPELVIQIEGIDSTPDLGYPYGKELIKRNVPFTALVAYNDISAIGAMKAFGEANLKIPQEVSIVGFDDISIASFSIPPLTTIRQPLEEMGRIAAKIVLGLIEGKEEYVQEVAVQPRLIARGSTAAPKNGLKG
jgi:DNA-binding LacI/PurR family transcriptional regulator